MVNVSDGGSIDMLDVNANQGDTGLINIVESGIAHENTVGIDNNLLAHEFHELTTPSSFC